MNSLPPTSLTPSPSIVVLPFANTSANLKNEYFCDGLAEELISALTKLAQLRVVARTSAFFFKGQNIDIREIGRRLNVGAVLEGSVRRAGNRLRITAQLVNVADGYDLWSERYDRQLTDIFDIQDEITLAIVEALKVKLLSGQQAVLLKRPTENLEAWEWYQKARWHFGLFKPDSFGKAIECTQKAVEADPDFAQAWAFMSSMHSMLMVWAGADLESVLAIAFDAAQKALALDDRLSDSHCAMGMYRGSTFEIETGERHFRRGLELAPNNSDILHAFAVYALTPQGKFDEALTQFSRAHTCDPLSMSVNSATGYAYYVARRYEEGLAHLRPLIEMAPTFAANYLESGRCLVQLGRLDDAIKSLERSVKLSGGVSFDLGALGHSYGLAGRRNDAEQILDQLRQRNFFAECALVSAGLGDIDEAFHWLEQSFTKRQAILPLHLKVEPGYDRLRDDPRYAELVEKVYRSPSSTDETSHALQLFQQAEQLYYEVLELEPSARAAFLDQACGDNDDLRREIESLLAAHEQAGSFIAGNAVEDHAQRILAAPDQSSDEDQPTAMLPNPLSNKLTDSSQRSINQYRVVSMLGKGGMGEVWLAEDTRLKRKVALKLLPAEFTNDADRLRRFEQEALAISALNHPNIITIHEIGEDASGKFIVMELVAGRTLRALAAEKIALDSLIAWGGQLAKALHVAHAAGITHRDIKPDNIMVRDDGYVKVLDFGLARLDAERDNLAAADSLIGTKSGVLLGTVKYMSPEQARGEKVTSATDIFALGILFYELATGTHPFNSTTLLGTLQQITTETPIAPARLNPDLPAVFNALILRMLEKDARLRPTALEIGAALHTTGGLGEGATGRSFSPGPLVAESARRKTVGREKERAELRSGFASARNGRGQLLCVAGEPGIGKTTLVEDFLSELAAEGQATIARGRCSERLAGTEAYLPLLEALESLLNRSEGNVQSPAFRRNSGEAMIPPEGGTLNLTARVMKQIAPTWYAQVVPLSSESEESARLLAEVKAASQERMKRELANFLQEVARLRPLVLFFDDLHWADVSTIDLLSFLAGKFDALNVLIVVTYRPSDMLLIKHPFLQIKPDLQARGVCRELLLEFLTEAEIAEYLALEFPGHRFPPAFPRLIHAKTEGSPLFMADLVRYLRDHSVIANTGGAWMLAQALPDIERELPESVRGMIERKIAQLSEEDRKLLTCASVQGYEFDSAVVAQVLNLDADEVEERLEKLERVFAFVKLTSEAEFPNGTLTLKYRFVHVLYQNALYAGLLATRKATLSRDVALALEACYGARSASVANELALLWEAARDYARSADSFLQAAGNAAQVNAHREAVQLAKRGLEALLKLPETPERDGRELGLQLTRGFSLMSVVSWAAPEAGTAFQRARQLCQQLGDDPRFFAVLNGAASHHIVRGEYEIARELNEQMRRLAEQAQNPALMVVALNRLSEIHSCGGTDLPLARKLFEQAIALDRLEYHPSYLLVSNESQGIAPRRNACYCLWLLGYSDQALAMAQEAVTLAQQLSHPFSLGAALLGTGVTYFFLRDWQSSQKEFEKIFALAEEYDLGDMLNWAIAVNALTLAFHKPTEANLERAKQEAAVLRAKGVMLCITWTLAGLAEDCWRASRSDEGLAVIAEALSLVESIGERSYEADLWRVKGELLLQAAADDAQTEAESCFQKGIIIAQAQSAKLFELRAATSLARLWQQQGKTAEARQMLAEIYGWFTEGFDTADLKDANALLAELSSEFNLQVVGSASKDTLKRELLTSELSTPSIAVLPFVNISNDPDNEYFCDGLAEELLNALSKIEALHVAARTSSFSFKSKVTDIREIGQKLNVGAVLEGSVRKSGNRLRITAQLINIADGYHLWSERYDRQMEDIFDIQDEISLAIVDVLKVKLLGAEKAAVLKRYTENTEAYELYLKGRFHYGKWTEEGLKKSIEFFNQAISQEPNFAPAYAGVVNAYVFLWFYGFTAPEESISIIKSAAARAVAIDNDSAESQFALTRLKFLYEWDWSGADRGFRRTLALNPNHAEAHEQYAIFLALMRRADEAIAMGRRALELDPLFLNTSISVGFSRWILGQYERLREHGEKLIEFAPDFFGGYWQIGIECWGTGKYEEAIAALQTSVACGANPMVSAYLGYLYGLTGKRDEAQKILHQLQELSAQRHLLPFELGIVHVGLGELDRAFEYLEKAYEQRAGILIYFKYIAAMMPGFRDEPRLADLLRRIGLPEWT